MSTEVTIPAVGESISEVSIGEWLKSEGDFVEREDPLVVIETDKATVEISAPQTGKLAKILKASGNTAAVSEVIAYIDNDAKREVTSTATPDGHESRTSKQASEQAASNERVSESYQQQPRVARTQDAPKREKPAATTAPAQNSPNDPQEDFTASQAETNGKSNTGPRHDDNTRSHSERVIQPKEVSSQSDFNQSTETARTKPALSQESTSPKPQQDQGVGVEARQREETIVPMSQIRLRIAERLVQAQQSAALLTTFNEIDMSAVTELREKHREIFLEKYSIKLGLMSFFVRAAVAALARVPEVNAEIRKDQIVYRNFYDIGVAIGGGRGLVVPILRNAQSLSFAEIETAIADFARRAKEGKLTPEELRGGTFTITNGGIYGSLLSTPITNSPQSAILGMHAIQDRPVARSGSIEVRPMMYVALTYDHRLIDGREAVTFLKYVKIMIEDPVRMLLEI